MRDYPVQVDVTSPVTFDRAQVLLRVVLAIVLGWLGITMGWLVWVLFAVLPLVAAVAVSALGSEAYLRELAPRLWQPLAWLLHVSAYMLLLVDRFPRYPAGDDRVELNIRFTGHPTIGSAVLRLVTSIPSGFVLCLLWFVSALMWLVAAGLVLVAGPMPRSILAFQRGVLRWQARLLAYHASLVAEYPPFSFETEPGPRTTLAVG